MELITPGYYPEFRCLAGACPDSCCKEWEVDVDSAAAAAYRALPGPLGEKLRSVLRDEDGCAHMTIEDGRCPMWQQDGLCRIQAQLGHDALCQVCRDFPRLRHDYGTFTELGLELSCPEAARLIFASDDTVNVQTVPGGDAPEYDTDAMATLLRSREAVLTFLAQREYPLPQALAILLLYAHSVQAELDGDDAVSFDAPDCLAQALQFAAPGSVAPMFDFFLELEILTSQWRVRLENGPLPGKLDDALLPLVRYGIRRYWLQAVSDYDLICRVKFIISACILISRLGGNPVQTAQLFSKEIENASENLEKLLDAAYSDPAFTDQNLLGLLLCTEKTEKI